ncbi:MAG: WYL domain-containing protein, partial [Moraxella sp.]|nr:WYL domain-containing protein [Moraxella sp.]
LVQDYALPPMRFNPEELEALVFGMRWVEQSPDKVLRHAAASVIAKIHAILPSELAHQMLDQHLYPVMKTHFDAPYSEHFTAIRSAMREERFVLLHYKDDHDETTHLQIVPLLLGYFDGQVALMAGFCLLRQDFCHFRVDRILSLTVQDKHHQPKAWL